ncbi:Tartrate-resistant acid phosphatase type 5 [Holothuria leucospilota]|uniref:Tartrate-resistant acid phosphatase type 5 n=1 Tax=Holothuria leucospilota TaxID=206669 RepID=A0A9Q1CA54_HOLLE|nr:Tartrate-resistant acid phosphatase type 5 [Holothuria leucospilota]
MLHSLNFICNEIFGKPDIGGIEDPPYTTRDQLRTADALATIASSFRLDFIAELGDNFYHNGVTDVFDPRFQDTFETVYDAESLTDVPWYIYSRKPRLGRNVHAQVEYSRVSERWNYPSLYYSKRFAIPGIEGASLLLIMIDTMIICGNIDHNEHGTPPLGPAEKRQSLKQLGWLESELASARVDCWNKDLARYKEISNFVSFVSHFYIRYFSGKPGGSAHVNIPSALYY